MNPKTTKFKPQISCANSCFFRAWQNYANLLSGARCVSQNAQAPQGASLVVVVAVAAAAAAAVVVVVVVVVVGVGRGVQQEWELY